jgi:ethanolamine utilization protein EutN
MKVGKVVGTVVSTVNIPLLDEHRLLLCDIEDSAGDPDGYIICIDVVDAGMGDTVLILDEGNSARQILGIDTGAIRAVIVGVVDELVVDGEAREVIPS